MSTAKANPWAFCLKDKLRGASEEEVERRMRERYPEAVALLVRLEESWRQVLSSTGPVP